MMLNISLDGGSTWSEYAPALMDFDRYPATLLRFVDGASTKEASLVKGSEGVSPSMRQAAQKVVLH
jgi:hypothetical protein